jgi:hypothetical protein
MVAAAARSGGPDDPPMATPLRPVTATSAGPA